MFYLFRNRNLRTNSMAIVNVHKQLPGMSPGA